MITNKEITQFIVKSINKSEDIKKYCRNTYNKDISIFIGANTEDPPSAENMPLVLLEPLHKSIGSNEDEFEYSVFLRIAIKGFNEPKIEDNVTTYDGIYEIEDLGNLIAERLKKEFGKVTNLDTYEVEFYHDEINAFPIYTGTIIAGLNVDNVIGDEKISFIGE